MRGIEIKDDTYAYIKVVQTNGTEIPVMDSSSRTGTNAGGYTNFILQSVSEQRMEKHQIVETFGDNYVFFFGEQPRFLDCQAVLVSTHDFDWRAEWWDNYENFWRGTKLVEMGARCYMAWDDIVIEGYMLQAAATEQSEQPYTVQLQFRFFVTKYQNINLYNVEQFPVRQSVDLPAGVELTDSDAFSKLQAYYQGDAAATRAQDSVPRAQSVLANQLSSGGYGVGPLDQNSPTATQTGPSTYSFGDPTGTISSNTAPTASNLGIGVAPGPLGAGGGSPSGSSLAQQNTISQRIRQLPPSAVTDPSIFNSLAGAGIPTGTNTATQGALRGLIADNTDEYVNGTEMTGGIRPYMQGATEQTYDPMDRFNDAVEQAQSLPYGLPYGVVNTLSSLGVDADNETIMRDMGLAPNFSASYVASVGAYVQATSGSSLGAGVGVGASTSFGGSASQPISFSPLSNSSYGVAAGAGIGVSALAGYYANSNNQSIVAMSPYYQYKDPLGAIYGNNAAQTKNAFNADAYKYVEGLGDPSYGYSSPYGGAGYGQAGFGDFGGTGFGSGSSTGDPGYLNPNLVVASGQVAAARPQFDMTALTPGPTFGATAAGGASINVGGISTGFSVIALDGGFADWVTEAASAQEPLYGQPAVGPGFSGDYQPDVGAYTQAQVGAPVSLPYVSAPPVSIASTVAAITSFGFA